jgi:hypothetical protein
VNIKGKKKVIDILGRHWHPLEEAIERTERYKQEDYDSLMIWEDELRLKERDKLYTKVKTFIYNPCVEIVKIVKIEKRKYLGKVYNIETEKNHNYFAKGVLVHNCGEGGMCLTNNKTLADRMRHLRNHAIVAQGMGYQHDEVGFNYRMTNLQAAIGLAQLQRINEFLQKRRWIANSYNRSFRGKNFIFQGKENGAKSICWLYSILTPQRDLIIESLYRKGIETRPFFVPLSDLEPYKTKEKFPISETISGLGLNLPTFTELHSTQVKEIANIVFTSCK